MFGHKAVSRGLVIYSDAERGIYSESFELWCRKLNDLTAENFKAGIAGLEQKSEDEYRIGGEMWPPSYAEFRALCFPNNNRDTQAHKIFPRMLAIEDQTQKEQQRALNIIKSSELLAMVGGNPQPAPELTEKSREFARRRLEQAKKMLSEKGPQKCQ